MGDSVYANVWPTHFIAKINSGTGDVTAVIDTSALPAVRARDHGARIMNGLVMWKELYEVKLVPAP